MIIRQQDMTKKELAKKLSKLIGKSTTSIIRDYKKSEILQQLDKRDLTHLVEVTANVIYGDLYSVDDEFDIEWESKPSTVTLRWKDDSNFTGEPDISVNGSEWVSWDEHTKCYIVDSNEKCMRIISFSEDLTRTPISRGSSHLSGLSEEWEDVTSTVKNTQRHQNSTKKKDKINESLNMETPFSGALGSTGKDDYIFRLTPTKGSRKTSRSKRQSRKSSRSRRTTRSRSQSRKSSRSRRTARSRRQPRRTSRSRRTARVQCKSYQERNESGRCINKKCKEGQIRDRETKKCRNKKNPLNNLKKSKKKSLRTARSRSQTRKSSRSRRTARVPCKSYQERNESGRCINKKCKEGKIRDSETKKCRNKKNPLNNLKKSKKK